MCKRRDYGSARVRSDWKNLPQMNADETDQKRSASDYLALAIATCGVGYLPLAPGTFGSLVGVGGFLLLMRVGPRGFLIPEVLLAIVIVTFAGIWAGTRTEK